MRPIRLAFFAPHNDVGAAVGRSAARRAKPAPVPRPVTAKEARALAGDLFDEPRPPRFRFAPSPTGHLHIGGARTALMNFLAAKRLGGEFVLRIEDTDLVRSKPEYTEAIKDGLKWLGIEWDGPEIYQSQRTALYQAKAQQLINEGHAYVGEGGAVFFRMPTEGTLAVRDHVKGKVQLNVAQAGGLSDYVIQRADGSPTFMLTNAVDDGEQGITHIIRGDDHLTNTLRQLPLIRALGYDEPEFFHVPLIHGDDGAKLSKRHGATSVTEYRDQGFEPTAVVNHLARLGASFDTERTLPVPALAEGFNPFSLGKSKSRIAMEALLKRNRRAIAAQNLKTVLAEVKARAAVTEIVGPNGEPMSMAQRLGQKGLHALADGARKRASTYQEAVEIGLFLLEEPVYAPELKKAHASGPMKKAMKSLAERLAATDDWSAKSLDSEIRAFSDEAGAPVRSFQRSLRWMLTGLTDGLPLHHTLAVLGKDEALLRLKAHTN